MNHFSTKSHAAPPILTFMQVICPYPLMQPLGLFHGLVPAGGLPYMQQSNALAF